MHRRNRAILQLHSHKMRTEEVAEHTVVENSPENDQNAKTEVDYHILGIVGKYQRQVE